MHFVEYKTQEDKFFKKLLYFICLYKLSIGHSHVSNEADLTARGVLCGAAACPGDAAPQSHTPQQSQPACARSIYSSCNVHVLSLASAWGSRTSSANFPWAILLWSISAHSAMSQVIHLKGPVLGAKFLMASLSCSTKASSLTATI